MPGTPKRLNHPLIAYLVGFIFMVLTLAIFLGVIHHLTISHHGPGLLRPLLAKHQEATKSEIRDEAQRLEEFEQHRHFHNVAAEYPQPPENLRPVCFICHSDLPHRKNKRIRALMNIHTQFFVCETCHIREKPGATIVYQWYSHLEDHPQGPFYGTSYDPDTGILLPGKDQIARIAPYFKFEKTGQLQTAMLLQGAPLARDFVKRRDNLNPEQREAIKNIFHENIKPNGHSCQKCHVEQSVLDFRQLGFSETRKENLKYLNVVGMIEKYEKFYLPELFPETATEGSKK
ncbi:MAG: hypothetical protein JSW26_22465 [Desulfobacterales bacterium]|nr:MAG: hypothetical protein JSW26_22465 [Desulfobacterales bacterium]